MRRAQEGQALVLMALLSAVLIGFVGLVADGGAVAAQQELAQSAADGASIAALYGAGQPGATTGTATTLAGTVLSSLGLPAADLSLTFLDGAGNPTSTMAQAASVQATVRGSRPTFFLRVLGVNSVQVLGQATSAAPVCALCVMGPAGTTVTEAANSQVTVSGGGAVINSTGNPNLSLGSKAAFAATSVTVAGGSQSLAGRATITPSPVVGSAAADSFGTLVPPSLAGAATAYSSPATSGSGSLPPGVYSSITVNGSYSLALAGTYVVTGPITVSGGSLTATGATVHLACTTYPAPCGAASTSCGYLNAAGGSTSITAPAAGTYANLALFADRDCRATNTVGPSASLAVTGTIYTKGMGLSISNSAQTTLQSVVVVDNLSLPVTGATLDISYSAAQNVAPKVALSL